MRHGRAAFTAGGAIAGLALLVLWPAADAIAGPVPDIPDAARPGALRPHEEDRRRVPEAPPDRVLDVPPLIDRPLDIDEGPMVVVERFELTGAVDRPEHRVHVEQIEALLEEKRLERPEGFTIGRLEEVAGAVTGYYRERGLILTQAVIPVQTVDDGEVTVEVLEGKLGRVIAEGNVLYDEETLTKPFRHLIGEPVTQSQMESALLTLTDFPGLSVFGVFQPGIRPGEADIVLKVQEENRFDVALRGDNHGTQETGLDRARVTIEWNNPTGGADRVTFTFQQTFAPRNNTFYSFDYERYLGRGYRLGAFIMDNAFDVGGEFADREIVGITNMHGFFLDKSFIRSRELNFSTRLDLTLKNSKTLTLGEQINRDKLTVLSLMGVYDSIDTRFSGLNFGFLELSLGFNDFLGSMGNADSALELDPGKRPSRQGGPPDLEFAEGSFFKLFGTFSRLQTVTRNTSLLLRAEVQWSPDLLVPVEQYAVGGPENVRSYPPAQALFDTAAFLSAEYIIAAPFITDQVAFRNRTWGELLQFSVFYDIATAKLNEPFPLEPQDFVSFQGAGVGLRFNLPQTFETRLMMSWKIGAREPLNDRFPQLWADVTWRF